MPPTFFHYPLLIPFPSPHLPYHSVSFTVSCWIFSFKPFGSSIIATSIQFQLNSVVNILRIIELSLHFLFQDIYNMHVSFKIEYNFAEINFLKSLCLLLLFFFQPPPWNCIDMKKEKRDNVKATEEYTKKVT